MLLRLSNQEGDSVASSIVPVRSAARFVDHTSLAKPSKSVAPEKIALEHAGRKDRAAVAFGTEPSEVFDYCRRWRRDQDRRSAGWLARIGTPLETLQIRFQIR